MFARVTTFAVKPAAWPHLIAVARDEVVPASQARPGFLRAELLTRSRISKAIYTSFWHTEFDAIEAERGGHLDDEMARFEPYAAGPAIVEGYEVSVLAESPSSGSRSTAMSQ
ncbi:MAG: hypothetical protein ACRDOS_02345 [Gaiellaceae bacterium]